MSPADGPAAGPGGAARVLAVDLDGTLLRSDMLHESFWAAMAADGAALPRALGALAAGGRAGLKRALAGSAPDVTTLPYDARVAARLEAWRAAGGRTALVTATDQALAEAVAAHLGLFDEVIGSDGRTNLKGAAKAARLEATFGRGGYVYAGDSAADLAPWAGAAAAISVGAAPKVRAALDAGAVPAEHLPASGGGARTILRALRPHQWLKNLLVFAPFLADPSHGAGAWPALVAAFVALCLAASSGYVLNDLLDLADDRAHPRKRTRPFASGALSVATGTWLMPLLLAAALVLAGSVSALLAGVVALYMVSTTAYSVRLKRHAIVDICMLAFLYTLRIIAGGAAIGAALSVWLLAFSMFLFFALASVKRLAEMSDPAAARRAVSRRGYRPDDVPTLSQMAISAGYLGVLVLALYVDQPDVQQKFGAPWLLWGVCPLLIFWISRMVLIARRGEMHDDPLVWTLANPTSRIVVTLSAAMILGAVLW